MLFLFTFCIFCEKNMCESNNIPLHQILICGGEMNIKTIIYAIKDLLCDNYCLICGRQENVFCFSCLRKIEECELKIVPYEEDIILFTFGEYEEFWKKLILAIKHNENTDLSEIYDLLSRSIVRYIKKFLEHENIESSLYSIFISFIPSSWHRRIRGKNNNQELASRVYKLLMDESNFFVQYGKLMEFKFFSRSQAGKDSSKRYENRKNSLIVLNENIPSRSKNNLYIIIEDVVTTGSTIKAFINELKKNIICDDKVLFFTLSAINITSRVKK